MLKFEYIDTIKYEIGKPRAMFLLADTDAMEGKRIAVFGTGLEAFIIERYLETRGLETECFVNNDPKMEGRVLCGRPVKAPGKIWGQDFFVVIAMGNPRYLNEVLWQIKVHGEKTYAVALMETYHAFTEDGKLSKLQELTMRTISRILCDGRDIIQVIHPIINVGPGGNIMFPFDELCWSTTWMHHLLQWFYDNYSEKDSEGKKTMLEIGPGKGLFSAVVHSMNSDIQIEWLMFDMEEKSEEAVGGRYNWWPASMFKTYYGMIEEPGYRINKKFDIIVMTEVMEHFSANPKVTICKIADMLKENGELYLSTPAWGHLPIYDTYEDIPDFSSLEEYKAAYIGHSYQYTRGELEEIMDECGLKIERYALTEGNNHNLLVKHK
ncbi:MAG: class I SAM-dependent methyltransferase [Eubacterium sp.]|nr:class I SAM-dependent methyltransferase [Eubacterium sp.]